MYENSKPDGNIDKAAISVSPDGAWRGAALPRSHFIWSLLKWSNKGVRAIHLTCGNTSWTHGGAMKALRPNAHLQHELPRAQKDWTSYYAYLTIISTNIMPFKSVFLNVKVAIPPWWCDKLPPLARISSLAACCGKKDKTLKQIMKSNGVVIYKKSNKKIKVYTSTCS